MYTWIDPIMHKTWCTARNNITSKNTPRNISGIFRASFGEASTLRVTIWVEFRPDAARHLLAMQKIRSKKWTAVRGSPSMELEPMRFDLRSLLLSVRLLNKFGKNWSCWEIWAELGVRLQLKYYCKLSTEWDMAPPQTCLNNQVGVRHHKACS